MLPDMLASFTFMMDTAELNQAWVILTAVFQVGSS